MFERERKKNNNVKIVIVIIGLILLLGGLLPFVSPYFSEKLSLIDEMLTELGGKNNKQPIVTLLENPEQSTAVATQTETQSAEQQENELVISAKTPMAETNDSLYINDDQPALNDSDAYILSEISNHFGEQQGLFVDIDIIRNIVVFIDNFSRGELISKFSPVNKPQGTFAVSQKNGITYINNESYQRYDGYANAIAAIDTDTFMDIYRLFSPLLDQAYQEIGYDSGRFNQTFDKAITHVLDIPIIHYKLEVISPSVMYQYADQNLESLPSTQKLMLRMGPNNLQIVKEKLQQIQNELQRL